MYRTTLKIIFRPKTDLNDAQALAFLAQDTQLRTIKAKDVEQQKYASLTTLREQYIKQYRQTIVSLKGICQAWGLNISKGISGKARLKDLIEITQLSRRN